MRVPYVRDVEYDIDTSTWLSAVIAVDRYPDKIWTLLNYTDARPLTVFPLVAGSWLGMPASYAGAEIIGLLLWLATVVLLYQFCRLFAGSAISLIIVWGLCIFLGTISPIFAAYNSEHVSIFMITAAISGLFLYVYRRWNSGLIASALGILLGSLVYAKFQNAPMGLLIGFFLLWAMAGRKDWKNIAFLIAGSLLPTALLNVYYASMGKLEVFWNNYFWNYFYYSFTTQFSPMPIAERFSIGRILRFLFYATSSGVYLLTLCSLAAALALANIRQWKRISPEKPPILFVFTFLLLILSVYAVLQAGNDFEHYKLFLFIPLLLFIGLTLSVSTPFVRKYAVAFLMTGCVLQTGINLKYLSKDLPYDKRTTLDHKIVNHIVQNTGTNDPVVVWGWRDGLLVNAGRAMGYRDVHAFHFSLKSPLVPFWTKDFLDDMEQNKPKLFIEAMIRDYSERGHLFLPHDQVPVIREYVRQHYRLVDQMDGVRIFRRIEGVE
ncbi:Bax inhibitor 1 family protein [Dyadobacter sp. MSC1_007]|uniref:hypothetical protein n=1 Tax=Dyadobacter sp. MSC1_007 TaxID=2909264 RepID=UPI00202E4C8C|nr:hypothetical protein [Dyadobacter sp. MSC1_007]